MPENLFVSETAVKRKSAGFWDGDRLERVVDVIRERRFPPGTCLTPGDLIRDAKQSAACGTRLSAAFPASGDDFRPYIHRGEYCQMPAVCYVCSRRVGDVRQARYAGPIETAFAAGMTPYLVTFTVPPGKTVREQYRELREALRAFTTRWRGRRRGRGIRKRRVYVGEWAKVGAAAMKIEVKRGSGSGEWHLHAHALVFTRKADPERPHETGPLDYRTYDPEKKKQGILEAAREVEFRGRKVPASKITAEWLMATQGRAMGLRVDPLFFRRRKVRGKWIYDLDARGQKIQASGSDVVRAAREVLKYVTVLSDDSPTGAEDWVEIREALWGRRLWSVFGGFRGLGDDDYTRDAPEGVVKAILHNLYWRGGWAEGQYQTQEGRPGLLINLEAAARVGGLELGLRGRVMGVVRRARSEILKMRAGKIPIASSISIPARDLYGLITEYKIDLPPDLARWNSQTRWAGLLDMASAWGRDMCKRIAEDLRDDRSPLYRALIGDGSFVGPPRPPASWIARRDAEFDLIALMRSTWRALEAVEFGGGYQLDAFGPDMSTRESFLERLAEIRARGGVEDEWGWADIPSPATFRP